jgi:YHS domain-containing protein
MATGGLIVEGLFSVLGLIPHRRPSTVAPTSFQWNYTTFLNIAFVVVAAGLYWLYRNRDRLGGGQGFALDPVCGMQVRTADAPAHSDWQGRRFWFCSDRCQQRFDAEPARYTSAQETASADPAPALDPVCGMRVDPASAASHRSYAGTEWYFCSVGCAEAFDADPTRHATFPTSTGD